MNLRDLENIIVGVEEIDNGMTKSVMTQRKELDRSMMLLQKN
jgi:hypothetical protein